MHSQGFGQKRQTPGYVALLAHSTYRISPGLEREGNRCRPVVRVEQFGGKTVTHRVRYTLTQEKAAIWLADGLARRLYAHVQQQQRDILTSLPPGLREFFLDE